MRARKRERRGQGRAGGGRGGKGGHRRGGKVFFPEIWNLVERAEVGGQGKPENRNSRTATRTGTDRHGRLGRGQRAESRGQGRHRGGGGGRVFPRYGKFIFDFCRCARKASLARPASPAAIDLAFALRLRLELGTRLFHAMEKSFPRCGKVLWGDGAARGGGRWGRGLFVGGGGFLEGFGEEEE